MSSFDPISCHSSVTWTLTHHHCSSLVHLLLCVNQFLFVFSSVSGPVCFMCVLIPVPELLSLNFVLELPFIFFICLPVTTHYNTQILTVVDGGKKQTKKKHPRLIIWLRFHGHLWCFMSIMYCLVYLTCFGCIVDCNTLWAWGKTIYTLNYYYKLNQ